MLSGDVGMTLVALLDRKIDTIFELGPGNFVKTETLLRRWDQARRHPRPADAQAKRDIVYVAVDINRESLQKTIPELHKKFNNITCVGWWGTFDQALERLKSTLTSKACVWSFGSSLSNSPESDAIWSIKSWTDVCDLLIIGQDATVDKAEVHKPYHMANFKAFIDTGRRKADEINGQEEIFASATEKICDGIGKDSEIEAFESFKYREREFEAIVAEAGCAVMRTFSASGAGSRIYVIQPREAANYKS
ncbi:hypothetical protein QQZ08_010133 [Neonectria magnoliae]|uniref:Histidine-specific methyltransferase SAM-dependent domain-containing protein n=1 Tax=Neonectria magnoliae TaxID=2732573 RepID=A0ABR1HJ49_9HYPO